MKNPIKDEKRDKRGDKSLYVLRSGSYNYNEKGVHVSLRYRNRPWVCSFDMGFRIVRNRM